jgi:hypothetical protein
MKTLPLPFFPASAIFGKGFCRSFRAWAWVQGVWIWEIMKQDRGQMEQAR